MVPIKEERSITLQQIFENENYRRAFVSLNRLSMLVQSLLGEMAPELALFDRIFLSPSI
jgi:hypothetical protein